MLIDNNKKGIKVAHTKVYVVGHEEYYKGVSVVLTNFLSCDYEVPNEKAIEKITCEHKILSLKHL